MPSEPTPTGAWFVNQEYNLHAPGCAPLPAAEVKHRDGHFFTLTGEAAAIADDVVRLLNARVGGAAPDAPPTDAPTTASDYADYLVYAAETLDNLASPRVAGELRRIAAWLRGGATAPTPDDPTDAAVQLAKDLFGYGQHGAACPKSVCGDGDCLCCDCGFAEAQSLAAAVLNRLRRDTGASHE
jgi:hypothetical protein